MGMVRNLHCVDGTIYRSGLLEKTTIDALLGLGVKTIISFKTDPVVTHWERDWCEKNGVNHIHLPMFLIPKLDERKVLHAYREVVDNEKPLLFHCTRGSDRTGVVAATYRILKNGWTYEATKKELYALGFNPVFKAWEGFLKELYYTRKSKNS